MSLQSEEGEQWKDGIVEDVALGKRLRANLNPNAIRRAELNSVEVEEIMRQMRATADNTLCVFPSEQTKLNWLYGFSPLTDGSSYSI